jgi:hypothetical protein
MGMPRKKVELLAQDRAKVREARAQAETARQAYKATLRRMIRHYPQAAVARALGISPQALSDLLKRR